jgi:hypothetical protein
MNALRPIRSRMFRDDDRGKSFELCLVAAASRRLFIDGKSKGGDVIEQSTTRRKGAWFDRSNVRRRRAPRA